MAGEELTCPSCGKLTEITTPSGIEITHIKRKSFWNNFVSSGLWKGYGTRMHTKCEHCDKKLAIWLGKRKLNQILNSSHYGTAFSPFFHYFRAINDDTVHFR